MLAERKLQQDVDAYTLRSEKDERSPERMMLYPFSYLSDNRQWFPGHANQMNSAEGREPDFYWLREICSIQRLELDHWDNVATLPSENLTHYTAQL